VSASTEEEHHGILNLQGKEPKRGASKNIKIGNLLFDYILCKSVCLLKYFDIFHNCFHVVFTNVLKVKAGQIFKETKWFSCT